MSELDLHLFYHHFSKPKGYIFPVQQGNLRTPPKFSWSSQLITSTKINQFYDQQPWDVYDQIVRPISFKPSGWFEIWSRRMKLSWIVIVKLYGKHHISCGSPLRNVNWILSWLPLRKKEGRDDLVLAPDGKECCS